MRICALILFCSIIYNDCISQTKFIISVSELVDYQTGAWPENKLINEWHGQDIVFTEDKGKERFYCKSVKNKSYKREYDRVKWTLKSQDSSSKKYRKSFSKSQFNSILAMTLEKDTASQFALFMHTSHHYLNFYVLIIDGADTIRLHKSKPFDSTTHWHVTHDKKGFTRFNNLNFDLFIYKLLPKKFIAKKRLLALPRKSEWE